MIIREEGAVFWCMASSRAVFGDRGSGQHGRMD